MNFVSGKSDDGDKMVPAIKKNFAELETGLVHLQQNIDIPEINLVIHPQILAVSFPSIARLIINSLLDLSNIYNDGTISGIL